MTEETPPVRSRVAFVAGFFRRHWILTALVVIALVVRAALPIVLRRVIEEQAQAAVHGHVEVGDVDLGLLWGSVALDDVALRDDAGKTVVVGWDRLYVRISWLALAERTFLVRRLDLVRPRIDVERLADGGVNLDRILVASEAPPPQEEAAPLDWRFALDDLRIDGGQIDFEDAYVKGAAPIQLEVTNLEVTGGSFAGDRFEGPMKVAANLLVEGASLRLDADVERTGAAVPPPAEDGELAKAAPEAGGIVVKTRFEVADLPIRYGIAYSPYGWEDLNGRLDLAGEWEIAPGTSKGRGRVVLEEVAVKARGVEGSGAAWSSLEVVADLVDLPARTIQLAKIHWREPSIVVEPGDPAPLPILRSVVSEAIVEPAAAAAREDAGVPEPPATEDERDSAPAPAEAPPTEPAADSGERWRWSVGSIAIEKLHATSRNGDRKTELDADLKIEGLAVPSENPATVELAVRPEQGQLDSKGQVRIDPLEIRSELSWKDLDLPALIATVPQPDLAGLRTASSSGSLRVASDDQGGIELTGDLSLASLSLEKAVPELPQLAWQSLDVNVQQVALPGLLASAPADPTIHLGSVRWDGLRVSVERDAVAAPSRDGSPAPAASPAPSSAPATGAGAAETAAAATVGPQVIVDELALTGGEVQVLDRTTATPVRADIAALELRVGGFRWPGRHVEKLDLTMTGPAGAAVRLVGRSSEGASKYELDVKDLELVPFEGYAQEYGGVTLEGGTASLDTTVDLTDERYESESRLVLHDLGVSGDEGEESFEKRFGVPLGLALALLRDVQGDIALDLPVDGGRDGVGVGFGKTLRKTLQRVLVNMLASPLKLIGSVAMAGASIGKFDVEPIPFVAGTTDFAPEAEERLASFGELLQGRPEVALRLEGRLARSDLARLREDDLRERIATSSKEADAALGVLGEDDAEAVREYLEEERPSEGAAPPEALRKALAKALGTIDVSRDRLIALGVERAEKVRSDLAARQGVDSAQLDVRPGTAEVRAKQPRVVVKITARSEVATPPAEGSGAKARAAPPSAQRSPEPAPTPRKARDGGGKRRQR